jgi:hypothetical protein
MEAPAMIRPLLTAALLAIAAPAVAQSTPAANYTDMWWNPSESGWGISFVQHAGTNQVFAVWYTYDPRELAASGKSKPLWFVMPGGTWTSPTRISGTAYVTNGLPFNQSGSNPRNNPVGTLTFDFANASSGTFSYSVAPPSGLASSDPAFNLPAMSGSKSIQRQSF